MKLALLSDSHDNRANLTKAISAANSKGCHVLIHAGDLMSPAHIEDLQQFTGKVIFVYGNNDNEKEEIVERSKNSNVFVAGDSYDSTIDGLRIYVTHYPEDARIAFDSGAYDVVVFGHTHQKMYELAKGKTLVNPGEIYGRKRDPASFAMYDTELKTVEFVEID